MSDDEDLFENPFFVTLRKKFATVYAEIEAGQHVLLVPSADSIIGTEIDQKLIGTMLASVFHAETHLLTRVPSLGNDLESETLKRHYFRG